ncbi:MAG: tRNA uracil 4-sulfurtransferase ThiI [Candidatus Micrarchaeia archaeon]
MHNIIFVNYGELWLRGRNRRSYINQLKRNLASLLSGEKYDIEEKYDRIIITPKDRPDIILKKLSYLFGISKYGMAYETEPDISSMSDAVKLYFSVAKGKRVRINAHRSYKGFSFNSVDIIKKVAGLAIEMGIEPSLREYNLEISINVTKEKAYVYTESNRGPGGLPVGSSGKGIILLSGGIDSPVAAWFAMKRGIVPVYIHLHQFRDTSFLEGSKIEKLTSILSNFSKGFTTKLYYIPSHYFSLAVSSSPSRKYESVLMKAFLFKVAEEIAKKEHAKLIFTGESLGQVASQTPSNIASSQVISKLPILRPLIGFNKEEIISLAKRIGTYETSIKSYPDVCSINVKNPATSSEPKVIKKILQEIKIAEVAKKSIKDSIIKEMQ